MLTEGRATEIARDTITSYLKRKDFVSEFTAGIADPGEKEAAIRKAGKPMGTIPRPGHSLTELVAEGYSFVAGLADAYLIRAGMQADVEAFRAGLRTGSD